MANDLALNIDTLPGESPCDVPGGETAHQVCGRKSRYCDSVSYETPDYWYIRRIRRLLSHDVAAEDVFYDLGSGKGRILCMMAKGPFKKVVGVELDEHLCDCAEKNATTLRGKHSPIEIIRSDAARADLSEGTVYFLFNPFGRNTLRAVCDNIESSLAHRPRPVRIVYYNAVYESVLDACRWLEKYECFETQNGLPVSFWSNQP